MHEIGNIRRFGSPSSKPILLQPVITGVAKGRLCEGGNIIVLVIFPTGVYGSMRITNDFHTKEIRIWFLSIKPGDMVSYVTDCRSVTLDIVL
jgi:hypothetical protein